MCGIYGIVFLSTDNVKPGVVRSIIRKLASQSQSRGSDATGLSFATKKGIKLFKHNVPATSFLKLENANQVIRSGVDFGEENTVYSMIGHTRAQTQGSHMNPDNNHPIKTGSLVGVHNGCIANDDAVFQWLESRTNDDIKRIAQVDSEAIFALINHRAKTHKFPMKMMNKELVGHTDSPVSTAIAECSSKLAGSFACAIQDIDNLKSVWLFRRNNPTTVNYYTKEGLIIFASEERFVDHAVHGLGFSTPKPIEMKPNTGLCLNVARRTYNRFDLQESEWTWATRHESSFEF